LIQPSAEPAPPIPADAEHAGGPEPIQNSERLPTRKEHLGSPSGIIPAIEPFLAVQNLSEEATPAEPLAAKMQEMGPAAVISPKEAAISPKNDPEAVSPPVSSPRSQELIARQVETSNDGEQKEPVDQETITSAPAIISHKVSEENTPAIGVEENASSGLPAPKSLVMRAADSEEPITPLRTAPPLAQLSNFLPVTADRLSTVRRAEMPLGLEQQQPMTFSPSTLSPSAPPEQHLTLPTARAKLSPVIQPSVSPSVEENVLTRGEELGILNNRPTQMISAALQEELPSPMEAPDRVAAPVQMKTDFKPLIFAQRPPKDAQTKVQRTPAPDVPLSIDRATEQSSFTDGISRKTSFDRQEFTSLFGSQALIQRKDIQPPESEVHSYSLDDEQLEIAQDTNIATPAETEEREESKLDFEAIAHEIYGLLRHRLEIEKERQGRHAGRLPW
jgi:hypothetical protein